MTEKTPDVSGSTTGQKFDFQGWLEKSLEPSALTKFGMKPEERHHTAAIRNDANFAAHMVEEAATLKRMRFVEGFSVAVGAVFLGSIAYSMVRPLWAQRVSESPQATGPAVKSR